MALDLDISRPLRGIDRHRDLVQAILGAHSSDELEWLEWKSGLDLNTKHGCFQIAKAILGMANRPVEVAARACAGYGYLVVGVEPENLAGVQVPDPAQWIGRVEVYLKSGSAGPSWDWTIVPVDGDNALVLTVDPPKDGDPPWPLRKELDTYRSGTLFVRKPGKTEPALAEDVDALGRRLLAGASRLPQLLLEIVGDVPVPWILGAEVQESVASWVERERDRHLAAALTVEDERTKPVPAPEPSDRIGLLGMSDTNALRAQAKAIADLQNALRSGVLGQFQGEPDRRTLAEYTAELDQWAAEFRAAALHDLPRRYCEADHGLVHLRVTNNSLQYLPGVEVQIHIAFEAAKGLADVPDGQRLPNAPRPYGQPTQSPLLTGSLAAGMPSVLSDLDGYSYGGQYVRDTFIEEGSIKATLDVGDLRPTASYDGDDFYVFLSSRPAEGLLHASWTATVQNRDGIIEGRLTIPVEAEPVDVGTLLSSTTHVGENESGVTDEVADAS
jgi:hypothetical protein